VVATIVPRRIELAAIGATAYAALDASGGVATVLAPLSASIYCRAHAEIVWLGTRDSTLHPRAMLARISSEAWSDAAVGETLRFDAALLTPWTPARVDGRQASRATVAAGARAVLAARGDVGPPDGFGALLGGGVPAFPLQETRDRVLALAGACDADDADGAADAAIALLGLGSGLTPSGDDLVGGVFFARTLLGELEDTRTGAWAAAASRVLAAAPARTHPISMALLSDMLQGRGHAPLHVLVTVLASAAPLESTLDAARSLTRIGHSSGWDMLAGFLGGILGISAFV
jgi:hypothetical protein